MNIKGKMFTSRPPVHFAMSSDSSKPMAWIGIAISALALLLVSGCGKPSIDGAPLPTFYGVFAIDHGKLFPLKDGVGLTVPTNATFLVYDKTVSLGVDESIYTIPLDVEPPPEEVSHANNAPFSWDQFNKDAAAGFTKAMQKLGADSTGIPIGAVAVPLQKKPVPNQPEMVQLVPVNPLHQGLYQFESLSRFWVDYEEMQKSFESTARSDFQKKRWLEASINASRSLLIGLSKTNLASEFTSLKFGSLADGAASAISAGDLQSAELLAKRLLRIKPPNEYLVKAKRLLEIDIPYAKTIAYASDCAKKDEWDSVVLAATKCLELNPGYAKPSILLRKSPEKAFKSISPIPNDKQDIETTSLSFTPDGRTLVALVASGNANINRRIKAWNVDFKNEIPATNGDYPDLTRLQASSPDGVTFARMYRYGPMILFNLFDEKSVRRIPPIGKPDDLLQLNFSKDGSKLLCLFSALPVESVRTIGLLDRAVALGLIATDRHNPFQQWVKACVLVLDVKTLNVEAIFGLSDSIMPFTMVHRVTATRQQTMLYDDVEIDTKSKTLHRITIWDNQSQAILTQALLSEPNVVVMGLTKDGGKVPIVSSGHALLWNWRENRYASSIEYPQSTQGNTFTFSDDTSLFAEYITGDSEIRIYRTDSGKLVHHLKEAPGVAITDFSFNPDGTKLAVGLRRTDFELVIWDLPENILRGQPQKGSEGNALQIALPRIVRPASP